MCNIKIKSKILLLLKPEVLQHIFEKRGLGKNCFSLYTMKIVGDDESSLFFNYPTDFNEWEAEDFVKQTERAMDVMSLGILSIGFSG
jgi:hypothetical protein